MKTVSILLLGLAIGLSGCSLHQRQEMEYAHYQDDAAAIREAHAAVDDDDLAAVLIDGHVLADLVETAKRNDFQFFCHNNSFLS